MSVLFGLLSFAAFVVFIIGMIKPDTVVFWSKKKSRGMACLYLAAMFVFSGISGASSDNASITPTAAGDNPSSEQSSLLDTKESENNPQTSNTPTSSVSVSSETGCVISSSYNVWEDENASSNQAASSEISSKLISSQTTEQPSKNQHAISKNKNQTYEDVSHEQTQQYVLNTNTKVFHSPSCRYVRRIKSENYATINSRSEAIAEGYSPCKFCNP